MIPKNSPIAFYNALCSSCGETMRPVLKRQANGVLTAVQFACDKCEYQVEASLPYINCMPAKYEKLPAPIVVPEVKPAVVPTQEALEEMKAALWAGQVSKAESAHPQPVQASAIILPAEADTPAVQSK